MKGEIHVFDPVIYPTYVWACKKGTTIDDIDREFYALCKDNTVVSFKDSHDIPTKGDAAKTYLVGHKASVMKGCLVYLYEPKLKDLSHEADHCADWLFEDIGENERSYEHGEAYAYYQSWVFECLYNVWRGRV